MPGLRDYCVVYFGNDWFAENRTSSHHIARRLSQIVPVLYVDSPGMRAPRPNVRDVRKLWRKLAKMFAPPRRVSERLYVMTAPQIPFRRLPLAGTLNRRLTRFLVTRATRRLRFHPLISWFLLPHTGHLAKHLGEDLAVYYCTDDHAAFPGVDARSIRRLDEDLTRAADVVFVAPPKLVEAKRSLNPNVHYAPHGVDVDLFAKASDPSFPAAPETLTLRHPVIGYFGNLGAWIDFDLLAFLARSRPQWTLLFVGYKAAEMGDLPACPNAVFVGPKPYETLPSWAKAFDCAVVPYRLTQQVKHANPLKLREYLATGKPVVSVRAPETDRFSDVLYLADTPAEYLAAIERALAEDTPERNQARRAAVAGLTWDARFRDVVAAVDQALATRAAGRRAPRPNPLPAGNDA